MAIIGADPEMIRPAKGLGDTVMTEHEAGFKAFLFDLTMHTGAQDIPLERIALIYAELAGDLIANKSGTSEIQLRVLADEAAAHMRSHAKYVLNVLIEKGMR